MENKNDRNKLRELLEYIDVKYLFMNRLVVKDNMFALTLSNDPFVAKIAEYFAGIVEKGNETFLRDDARIYLSKPEFKAEYDTNMKVQMREYPRSKLAQARSYAARLRKRGIEVEERIYPNGDTIVLRWRETSEQKEFDVNDLLKVARFVEDKKKKGIEVSQKIVNDRIVVKWILKQETDSQNSTTSQEKPDTQVNLKS